MALLTWNALDGNWNLVTNWDLGRLPETGDDVEIPLAGITTTFNGQTGLPSLVANSVISDGALTISGGTLTVDNTFRVNNTLALSNGTLILNGNSLVETLNQTSGTLGGSGTLEITMPSTWSAGTMSGEGRTIVQESAVLNLINLSTKGLNRRLENEGIINYEGAGLTFGSGENVAGVINNQGTFNSIGEGDFFRSFVNEEHAFNNAGVFNRSGEGTTRFLGVAFNNTGTVNVDEGTLNLEGGTSSGDFVVDTGGILEFAQNHTLTADSSISGDSVVFSGSGIKDVLGAYEVSQTTISGGTTNFNSTSDTNRLTLSNGILAGSADFNLTGTAPSTWSAGTMTGAGRTIVQESAVLNLINLSTKGINRRLENGGIINYEGAGLTFGSGENVAGVINNQGTFNSIGEGDFFRSFVNEGHAFNNAGVFNRSGEGTTRFFGVVFNNTGTVNVDEGTLQLETDSTHRGSLNLESGTTLGLQSATHDFNSGASVSGEGVVLISSSGTVNVNDDLVIPNLTLNGGQVTGASDLQIGNEGIWSSGTMTGEGRTIVQESAVLNLVNTGGKGLNRTLENEGIINYEGSGLTFGSGENVAGVINNQGTFNSIGEGDFFRSLVNEGHAFNNAGVFNRSGEGTTRVFGVAFNNTGTVNIDEGILSFEESYQQDSGSLNLNSTEVIGRDLVIDGGSVTGTGDIDSTVTNSGGILTPGLTPGEIGTLNIFDDYVAGETSEITIDIAATDSHDVINFNTATSNNSVTLNGRLNVNLVGEFAPEAGQSFTVLTFDGATNTDLSDLEFSVNGADGLGIGNGLAFEADLRDQSLVLTAIVDDLAAPIANAGDSYSVNEGGTLMLDGSASSDANQTTSSLSFEWDLDGDDIFGETGANAALGDEVGIMPTFDASGLDGDRSNPIRLRVTDADGLSSVDSTTVEVLNLPPTANAGSNTSVILGQTVALNGLGRDPAGEADPLTYEWDLDNDGVFGETGANAAQGDELGASVTFDSSGLTADTSVSVTLRVTDDEGASTTDTLNINILPDDPEPSVPIVSITPANRSLAEGNEGSTAFTFTVSLSVPSEESVSVQVNVEDGTAIAPSDFVDNDGLITFAPGETSQNITIQVNGDTAVEEDENFTVTLSAPTNATLGDQVSATGLILNDDDEIILTPGQIEFGAATYTLNEDGTTDAAIALVRSGGSDGEVSVTVTPSNGSAIAPDDFDATPIVVTFAEGETEKTIVIPVIDDAIVEEDETLSLTLSEPSNGATLGDQINAEVTILDNDEDPNEPENQLLEGTPQADELIAASGDDTLLGRRGDDLLLGENGNDLLKGEGNNDTLMGGLDNDTLIGNRGDDRLLGNEGDDELFGNTGADTLLGGDGNDFLFGGDDHDWLNGGKGDDTLKGGRGKDTLNGGSGNDLILGRGRDDILVGGTGNDTISGALGKDILNGGSGDDELMGHGGADKFQFLGDFTTLGIDAIADMSTVDILQLSQQTFQLSGQPRNSILESDFAQVNSDPAAQTSSALIVYNSSSGALFYNANGSESGFGAGGQFATLTNQFDLQSTQIQLIR